MHIAAVDGYYADSLAALRDLGTAVVRAEDRADAQLRKVRALKKDLAERRARLAQSSTLHLPPQAPSALALGPAPLSSSTSTTSQVPPPSNARAGGKNPFLQAHHASPATESMGSAGRGVHSTIMRGESASALVVEPSRALRRRHASEGDAVQTIDSLALPDTSLSLSSSALVSANTHGEGGMVITSSASVIRKASKGELPPSATPFDPSQHQVRATAIGVLDPSYVHKAGKDAIPPSPVGAHSAYTASHSKERTKNEKQGSSVSLGMGSTRGEPVLDDDANRLPDSNPFSSLLKDK